MYCQLYFRLSSQLILHRSCLPVHAIHITSNVTLNQLEQTPHSKLEMGKNPHCSGSVLFGLFSFFLHLSSSSVRFFENWGFSIFKEPNRTKPEQWGFFPISSFECGVCSSWLRVTLRFVRFQFGSIPISKCNVTVDCPSNRQTKYKTESTENSSYSICVSFR